MSRNGMIYRYWYSRSFPTANTMRRPPTTIHLITWPDDVRHVRTLLVRRSDEITRRFFPTLDVMTWRCVYWITRLKEQCSLGLLLMLLQLLHRLMRVQTQYNYVNIVIRLGVDIIDGWPSVLWSPDGDKLGVAAWTAFVTTETPRLRLIKRW